MVKAPKLAKNTLYYTMASVGVKVISFIYFTILARTIGADGTGEYFLALAIIFVVSALSDAGLNAVLIREVAKKPKDARLWVRSVLGFLIVTIPLAALIAVAAPHLLQYSADVTRLVYVALFIMIADTISRVFFGILRGLHELKYESIGIFVGQIATATIGLSLIATHTATLPLLIVALLAGSVWNVLFSAIQIVRFLGWKALVPTHTMGWKPVKMALAFFLAAIFVKVYSYVDSIVLSKVIGEVAVGIYAVAYKMTYAFQFVPLAFVAALYPTMSSYANNTKRLKTTLMDAFWYLSLIGFPIVFGIWSIAPEVIHAFYGEEFTASILPFQVLIFVLIPIFLDFPIGSLLNATNRQHIKTAIMGAAMVINFVANMLLIPAVGVVGASISGLISFTFLFVAGWFFARRVVPVRLVDLVKKTGGLFVSAVVMAIVVLLVKPYTHFVLAIPLGAVTYIAMAFATRSVSREHLKTLKRLVLKKPTYVEEDLAPNA